jgi:hypothetical protein
MKAQRIIKPYVYFLILYVILSLYIPIAVLAGQTVVIDDFESGLKSQWERKSLKGETKYSVVNKDGSNVLKSESNASATGLIYKDKYDPNEFPILTWRWKVENIISKGDETKKGGDDYAARVYVIFPHWFPSFTKSINYIWANKLPKGGHIPNPFYARAIMVAVESGEENIGDWLTERRNIYEDYRMLFGEDPPSAFAIAIMTDTDNTGESAVAFYDDIRIEKW